MDNSTAANTELLEMCRDDVIRNRPDHSIVCDKLGSEEPCNCRRLTAHRALLTRLNEQLGIK